MFFLVDGPSTVASYPFSFSEKQDYLFTYDPQNPHHRQYEPILPLLLYDTSVANKVYLLKQAKKELSWYRHLQSLGNKDLLLTVCIFCTAVLHVYTEDGVFQKMAEKRRACHLLQEVVCTHSESSRLLTLCDSMQLRCIHEPKTTPAKGPP